MADNSSKIPKDLFKNIKFFLAEEGNDKVKDLLKQGGATREFFFSNLATHVVSSTTDFPEYEQAKELEIPMVKPEWVIYSVKCEAVMPTSAFSIEKKLFSQMIACPSQIPPDDRDALWAMITFYGGRCQTIFDSNCTHLLVPKPEGEKYDVALQHQEKVKIVVPEWIVDCIKANKLLDESKYAPVCEPGTQSQSILTPDNEGQTTGAVVGVEKVPETPSALLSPESPALSKFKKLSAENKESENTSSEKLDLTNDEETTKDPNGGLEKRPARHAAETAKKELASLVKDGAVGELDQKDEDYKNDKENLERSNEGKQENEDESGSQSQSNSGKEIIVSKLLSGCVFCISDYHHNVAEGVLNTWKKVIRQNAGEVEDMYTERVTHVLCFYKHGKINKRALQDGKRLVTCHWLNDVILKQRLFAPQTSLHLPVPFRDKVSRCRNMIISVTGFQGEERETLKHIIHIIGAKYTGYLSRSVTHLICRTETSEKYKKAKEWGIVCTNARWLGDIMTGGCDYPVNMKRYKTFGNENELDINQILARELLEAWKDFETPEYNMDKKRKLEMLEKEMQEYEELTKRPRLEEPARTPEPPISTSNAPVTPRVVFTGLNPGAVRRLTEKLTALGGETATSIRTCTHIVASKIMRTIKFLTGISICRYIVSPQWIDKSHEEGRYLDEKDYVLHDEDGEKLYGMSLPQSIERAQRKPLFQGITFYVTANVRPDQKSMAEILDCAGGKVNVVTLDQEGMTLLDLYGGQFRTDRAISINVMKILAELPPKSSLKSLVEQKTEDDHPAFVCVTCEEDTHLCKDMKMEGIGVHNVEFVLSGILKQQLDFYRYPFSKEER